MTMLTHFGREFVAGTPLFWCEIRMYATLAVKLHVALDRHKRHSKDQASLAIPDA